MSVSRRTFLKLSAGAISCSVFTGLGIDLAPVAAHAEILKFQKTLITTTVCCYCAVGCGLLVHTADEGAGRSVNVEGDPDHPVNQGALCPKGAAMRQMAENKARPPKPMYRAAGAAEWKEVEWDWAYTEIAKRVKSVRDASFMLKNDKGETVNRTEQIVSLGSAALDNEECWTLQAMQRALGLVHIEHQARI